MNIALIAHSCYHGRSVEVLAVWDLEDRVCTQLSPITVGAVFMTQATSIRRVELNMFQTGVADADCAILVSPSQPLDSVSARMPV